MRQLYYVRKKWLLAKSECCAVNRYGIDIIKFGAPKKDKEVFMLTRLAASVAMMGLLSACGGEETARPPGGVSVPAPTPTPAPTPPPVSYTSYAQLEGDQSFQSTCAVLRIRNGIEAEGVLSFGQNDGVVFEYTSQSRFSKDQAEWSITGDTLDLIFTSRDLRPSDDNVLLYAVQIVTNFIQVFAIQNPQYDDDAAEYVRATIMQIQRFDRQVKNYYCVLGVPLKSQDRLPSVDFGFDGLVGRGTLYREEGGARPAQYFLGTTSGTAKFDRSRGRFTLELDLTGDLETDNQMQTEQFGNFTGDISLVGNPRQFEGPLLDRNGRAVGEFSGVFFGPQGTELGIVYSANARDRTNRSISFGGHLSASR
ncbi:MAG: hypothetical protein WA908_13410 [Pontixanthobacter sp.]